MHPNTKKIFISSDHAGFEIKRELVHFLEEAGFEVFDKGAFRYDPDDDYPDFIFPVAIAVSKNKGARGIILGGSGEGEAMAANRVRGVRAAVYYGGNLEIIKLSRLHNDANILSLGARFIDTDLAKEAVGLWLSTKFSEEERHKRRVEKIDNIS